MYLMRAFAIISIICAHCATTNDNSLLWDYSFSKLLSALGILGVPVFFFSSGYFFYQNQRKDYSLFLFHKIKTFFLPWLFTATFVYLYVALRKEGVNIKSYIYFLIGIQSYTYFLSVLIIFYLCMLKSKYSNQFIAICVTLSVLSLTLTTAGVLNSINPYCNPFNWLIYFMLGILFKRHNILKLFALFAMKYIHITLILFILINLAFIVYHVSVNYWSVAGYFYIFIGCTLLWGVCFKYHAHLTKFDFIGKESLAIYLIHMPFAGVLVYITNRFELWYLLPLRPFIVLSAVVLVIISYKKISAYFNIENYSFPLMGLSRIQK